MADRLAQLLGALSLSATDRFRAGVDGSLGRGGAHSGALVHLDAYPGESVQELATVLGVSQPAAVKLADRLSADGLLERRPGRDNRTRALHLTPEGRRRLPRCSSTGPRNSTRIRRGARAATNARDLEPLLEKLVAALAGDRGAALDRLPPLRPRLLLRRSRRLPAWAHG